MYICLVGLGKGIASIRFDPVSKLEPTDKSASANLGLHPAVDSENFAPTHSVHQRPDAPLRPRPSANMEAVAPKPGRFTYFMVKHSCKAACCYCTTTHAALVFF